MNIQQMMKQARKMQAEMEKMQESLKDEEVQATAGGGMVKVRVSGSQELLSIQISPEVVDPNDVELLEDMVKAAVNEGLRASQELASQRLSSATGGLNIPGLF